MKQKRAPKLPLFDGESGRTNSLKEVLARQIAAADVAAMWSLFKYAVLHQPLIIQHYASLYNLVLLSLLELSHMDALTLTDTH